jgi:hypothetical protein
LCTPRKIPRSVTHPEIALGQARLTVEFFSVGVLEKKVYLSGLSILSTLLSLEPGCHNSVTNVTPFEFVYGQEADLTVKLNRDALRIAR